MQENAKICALDRLLLERFGGRVGRGLALERSRRRDVIGYRRRPHWLASSRHAPPPLA
jgi:hypothetical protein